MPNIQLINKVKYNPIIYYLYYKVGSFCLHFIRLFIKANSKLIVFVSFGGRKFDDSPKSIYYQILGDSRFVDYRLVWAFINPDTFSIPRGEKVQIDTPKYFFLLLKARCWITNSCVERGLSISGKNTFYLNTWHGTAMKKMGEDIASSTTSFKAKSNSSNIDLMLAQGQYDVDLFSRVFGIPISNFMITGLPRNDELISNNTPMIRDDIKRRLGISNGKKVILYAPTFREYTKDPGNNVIQSIPLSFDRLKQELSDDFVILLRAHYEVLKVLGIQEDSFLHNVSTYPCLNDLMLVSDMLVSDYSSIFFDYSILEKPMLCYAYDYQEYQEKRGLYFDVRVSLDSFISNEDELINEVKRASLEPEEYVKRTVTFRTKYVTEYGDASRKCADIIYKAIQ